MPTARPLLSLVILSGLFLASVVTHGSAQVPEVRIARQLSMGYLQFNIMEHEQLLEKHAKVLGIAEIKVAWNTLNSPAAMNDALLSGSIDIVSGGVPGLLTIWARTLATPNPVKGVAAFSSQPILLNTRKENVKTIADFSDQDKIAALAVKVSVQAMMLQMAAAMAWGQASYGKLDPLTVGMSPPDATAALLSGSTGITSVFSVPPFQYQQLENAGIHTVLSSYDVFGDPHTFTVAWITSQFRDKNPTLYKALIAAFDEATRLLNKDAKVAGQYWIDGAKSKMTVEDVAQIATGKQVKWTMVPENTMQYAHFMHVVGAIKVKPAVWKDLFFPEVHMLAGS
jgi:NitT/TauT family transport system substrate-binding protein